MDKHRNKIIYEPYVISDSKYTNNYLYNTINRFLRNEIKDYDFS
jgi:hypothetical protein